MERKNSIFSVFIFGILVLTILPFSMMDAYAITPDVRAIDSNTNQIIQIDPTTGNILGGFPTPDPSVSLISGLTFSEGGNTLLFHNVASSPSTNLYRIDPSTGAVLNVHFMGNPGNRGGLSFETGAGTAGVDAIFAIMDGLPLDRQDGYNGPLSQHVPAGTTFPGALGGDDAGRHFLFKDNLIEEFNPFIALAPPINIFPAPSVLTGLAFDGINLYASTESGIVFTLDPNTGAILNQVQVTGVTLTGLAAKQINIAVGGSDVSINTSALLLAGVSSISMWMIPVVIAGIGIGVFVISKRK